MLREAPREAAQCTMSTPRRAPAMVAAGAQAAVAKLRAACAASAAAASAAGGYDTLHTSGGPSFEVTHWLRWRERHRSKETAARSR
eukprot:CAMPEP_0185323118 /NCGR_PEP_ID=MMETSP1363-20130426/61065_1 /TAXON_ID=38817 /ORGANISM="Gephyrocapsa oceanica, Strain RCC1303" /LENGTH=85 /DNA_ID=CAMNT_0027921687 /DNA_START=57 /DNA_END=310 /DNA_ORIENTATION=+